VRTKEQILSECEPEVGVEGNFYLFIEVLVDIRDQLKEVADAINRPQIRYTSA